MSEVCMNGTLFPLDWCKRWRGRAQRWQPTREPFNPATFTVESIDADTPARDFIVEHHYSGSYVAARHRFGLYDAGQLVGVAVYSNPATAGVLTYVFPELDPRTESVELGRFVLLDEVGGNAETWFQARCEELLIGRGVYGVVSFSDPVPRRVAGRLVTPGHVGTIYQAFNAIYTGVTDKRTLWVLPDGSVFNGQAQQKIRQQKQGHEYAERQLIRWGARPMRAGQNPKAWLAEAREDARVTYFRHPGVHRYALTMARTKRERRQIRVALPAQQYPKRRETREMVTV